MSDKILNLLYGRRANAEIVCNIENKRIKLDVSVVGLDSTPDCVIGHFGYNFYVRTPKGMKREKYNSLGSLVRGCGVVLRNANIIPLEFQVNTNGIMLYKYDYVKKSKVEITIEESN